MAISAQYSAGRPGGMRKKKGRYAPIIEEQAKMGLATKMVTEGKAREQAKKEWEFQKKSRESELAMQQKQLKMQKKKNKFDKYMGIGSLALGAFSTGLELFDLFG
jgi:hypothetical protein